MKEVSKEEFYNSFYHKEEVTLKLEGSYPYTANFLKNGKIIAKSTATFKNGKTYPIVRKYFI